jgi:hypothetical protein
MTTFEIFIIIVPQTPKRYIVTGPVVEAITKIKKSPTTSRGSGIPTPIIQTLKDESCSTMQSYAILSQRYIRHMRDVQ